MSFTHTLNPSASAPVRASWRRWRCVSTLTSGHPASPHPGGRYGKQSPSNLHALKRACMHSLLQQQRQCLYFTCSVPTQVTRLVHADHKWKV